MFGFCKIFQRMKTCHFPPGLAGKLHPASPSLMCINYGVWKQMRSNNMQDWHLAAQSEYDRAGTRVQITVHINFTWQNCPLVKSDTTAWVGCHLLSARKHFAFSCYDCGRKGWPCSEHRGRKERFNRPGKVIVERILSFYNKTFSVS